MPEKEFDRMPDRSTGRRGHCPVNRLSLPFASTTMGLIHRPRLAYRQERLPIRPTITEPTMDLAKRRELARRALDGYDSGPDATTRALADAQAKIDGAVALILVEGLSDRIALETAAAGRGRDLEAERVVIVPIGGAHAIGRFLTELGPLAAQVRLSGLCDVREEEIFRRALVAAGVGSPRTRADMAGLGFEVCVDDLEQELIRAIGPAQVEALFDSQGDLGSFRSLQSQPAWRGQDTERQMWRFLRAGSRRNLRYARLLTEAAMNRGTLPRPLASLVDRAA
ncbi:TOPRIM nucleotidyl transferase/hydrolase domain-containing protein [Catellatospora sp. NPDC049111]|uniref:TOPRIM nucleotidyl transferase/hydrolase domain-containing protein n=1 Tax=Catellatospora sp. NPDC049111 TaxID=3155271 RepID=UPI0033D6A2CF